MFRLQIWHWRSPSSPLGETRLNLGTRLPSQLANRTSNAVILRSSLSQPLSRHPSSNSNISTLSSPKANFSNPTSCQMDPITAITKEHLPKRVLVATLIMHHLLHHCRTSRRTIRSRDVISQTNWRMQETCSIKGKMPETRWDLLLLPWMRVESKVFR